MEEDEPIIT